MVDNWEMLTLKTMLDKKNFPIGWQDPASQSEAMLGNEILIT